MARTHLTEIDETTLAGQAASGDRRAFDELHERLSPAAWRLAVVTAADQDAAEAALADGMAHVVHDELAHRGPLRIRALATTLGALTGGPDSCSEGWPPAPDDLDDADRALVAGFAELPASYRSALWLADAERLPLAHAATVTGQSPAATGLLILRARAGLRSSLEQRSLAQLDDPSLCRRARRDLAGPTSSVSSHRQDTARRHVDGCDTCQADLALLTGASLRLRSVIDAPLTPGSQAAWARWKALTDRSASHPLGLVLPGGRTPPAWVERAIAGTAAGIITLGIATAVALGARDGSRPDDADQRSASGQPLGSPGGESAGGDGSAADPLEPIQLDPGPPPPSPISVDAGSSAPASETVRGTAEPATTGPVQPAGSSEPAPAPATTAETAPPPPPPPPPSTPPPPSPPAESDPALQIDLRPTEDIGVSLGDKCTGIEIAGTTIGCVEPDSDEPIKVGGSLLGLP